MLGFGMHPLARRTRYRPLATMIAAPSQVIRIRQHAPERQSSATPQASAVYSNGAITEASPRRNASVIANWPSEPATPMPTITSRRSARTGTQRGSASAPAPIAIIAISQNTMPASLSVRASTRTVIADTA